MVDAAPESPNRSAQQGYEASPDSPTFVSPHKRSTSLTKKRGSNYVSPAFDKVEDAPLAVSTDNLSTTAVKDEPLTSPGIDQAGKPGVEYHRFAGVMTTPKDDDLGKFSFEKQGGGTSL